MRLLIVGTLNGQIGTATRIAVANGAKVTFKSGKGMAAMDYQLYS